MCPRRGWPSTITGCGPCHEASSCTKMAESAASCTAIRLYEFFFFLFFSPPFFFLPSSVSAPSHRLPRLSLVTGRREKSHARGSAAATTA